MLSIKPMVENFIEPRVGTAGSAGLDLAIQEDVTLEPLYTMRAEMIDDGFHLTSKAVAQLDPYPENKICKLIDLGFQAKVPEGYVAFLCPRSGMGVNKGISLRNTIGVIDSDYRGNWMAAITRDFISYLQDSNYKNLDSAMDPTQPITLKRGEYIVQAIILPIMVPSYRIVKDLDKTGRGDGAMGSTDRIVTAPHTHSITDPMDINHTHKWEAKPDPNHPYKLTTDRMPVYTHPISDDDEYKELVGDRFPFPYKVTSDESDPNKLHAVYGFDNPHFEEQYDKIQNTLKKGVDVKGIGTVAINGEDEEKIIH